VICQADEVKNETSLPAQYKKYAKYKWEFLRRNQEYIKEWNKLNAVLKSKYGDWRPPDGSLTKEESAFSGKWKITDPIPPYRSYDYFILSAERSNSTTEDLSPQFDMHTFMFRKLFSEAFHERPITITDEWKIEDGRLINQARYLVADTGTLMIELDLNYSKKKLTDNFKILLDEWKKFYEQVQKNQLTKKQKMHHPTYHFDKFDNYLKVYDLRKKKVSWSRITQELKLNGIQSARNHYNSALRVIDEGIDLYIK
jgi:hypothetical protein